MENETDFFAHTLSFKKKKQENRNRIQKIVFPTFPSKNNFFYCWIHQKKSTVKKRNRVYKKNQKKESYTKMRNHFSRDRKTKHGKNKLV